MFDTVLLPIDLTHRESWEKALPAALHVMEEGGTLHVLGIAHDLGVGMVASYLPPNFEKDALQKMKAALDSFRESEVPEDVAAEVHVGHGHVPERIIAAARDVGADLIVMSSHPPDDLKTLLVGSNADKVVRHSPIPVLVVR